MLTPSPQASVVVCTYDRARTLGPALDSLFGQRAVRECDFEIVVLDDGSTDETPDIIRRAAARSPVPLRQLRTSGLGVAAARNRCLEVARGRWVAFFDDDQIAEPDWLGQLLRAARQTGAGIVGGIIRLRFHSDPPPRLGPLTRQVLGGKDYGPRLRRCGRFHLVTAGNALVRRDVFDRIGRFDAGMQHGMTDVDFMLRALHAGVDGWYTPHAVVHHVLPPHRLGEDYLRWKCLRSGANLAFIYNKLWGPAGMLPPCFLRAGHALTWNLLLAALARVAGRRGALLERKCYRWMAEGSGRMTLNLLFPRAFPQSRFLERLTFRAERHAFGGGA